jgi:anti-sigma factor RsiW
MSKDHEERELLSAYLDGELSSDEQGRVEAHLASCEGCRAGLEALASVKRVVSGTAMLAAPDDLVGALQRKWRPEEKPDWRAWLIPKVWVPAGVAALAALLLGLWLNPGEEEIPIEPLIAAHARSSAESWLPHSDLLAANFSAEVEREYDH